MIFFSVFETCLYFEYDDKSSSHSKGAFFVVLLLPVYSLYSNCYYSTCPLLITMYGTNMVEHVPLHLCNMFHSDLNRLRPCTHSGAYYCSILFVSTLSFISLLQKAPTLISSMLSPKTCVKFYKCPMCVFCFFKHACSLDPFIFRFKYTENKVVH